MSVLHLVTVSVSPSRITGRDGVSSLLEEEDIVREQEDEEEVVVGSGHGASLGVMHFGFC